MSASFHRLSQCSAVHVDKPKRAWVGVAVQLAEQSSSSAGSGLTATLQCLRFRPVTAPRLAIPEAR